MSGNNGRLRGVGYFEQEAMVTRKQTIVYLGDSPVVAGHCRWLEHAGLSVRQATSTSTFEKMVLSGDIVAVLVDLSMGDSELAGIDAVDRILGRLTVPPALLFLSDRTDQEVRLRAVQAGCECFLLKPVTATHLMQHLEPALLAARHECRILLIGESPDLLSAAVPVLQQLGMVVKRLDNVSQALLTAINLAPDLLIIEQALSCCRGDQLGRMFHQLADYEDLPVIYVVSSGQEMADIITDPVSEAIYPESAANDELAGKIERMARAARLRRRRIHRLQTADAVSGLMNQRGFLQKIARRIEVEETPALVAALVLVDVENMQLRYPQMLPQVINRLLALLANLLATLVAPTDSLARIGDYRFACLVTDRDLDAIARLGEFLGHSLSSRILDVDNYSLTVGCSVGVAVTQHSLDSGMPLYLLAQQACSELQLDTVSHANIRLLAAVGDSKKSQDEQQLLSLLKEAVKNSHFKLVFQPIASLRGTADEKYEVLLRLPGVAGRAVSPSRFVPLAEDHGLMLDIDRWVIEHAVQTLNQQGNGACFFVKVSPATLADSGFASFLKDCLERHSAAGEQLVFGLSVDSISAGVRQAAGFSKQVAMLNCRTAIEYRDANLDLGCLFEHISAAFVKLGGDMIKDLEEDRGRQLQLVSVVQTAAAHDAQVIAGFVESAACLKLLWQSGVHYIQGNFLQEPDEVLGFDFGGDET